MKHFVFENYDFSNYDYNAAKNNLKMFDGGKDFIVECSAKYYKIVSTVW